MAAAKATRSSAWRTLHGRTKSVHVHKGGNCFVPLPLWTKPLPLIEMTGGGKDPDSLWHYRLHEALTLCIKWVSFKVTVFLVQHSLMFPYTPFWAAVERILYLKHNGMWHQSKHLHTLFSCRPTPQRFEMSLWSRQISTTLFSSNPCKNCVLRTSQHLWLLLFICLMHLVCARRVKKLHFYIAPNFTLL